jgi:hypothetical protein
LQARTRNDLAQMLGGPGWSEDDDAHGAEDDS